MSLERFLSTNERTWIELTRLVDAAGSRPHQLGGARVRRLGALYRQAAADLAQAKRRFPGDPVVFRLEDLVTRARSAVYGARRRNRGLVSFFTDEYWRVLTERRGLLATSTALLLVPAVIGAVLAIVRPETVTAVVPADFLWVTQDQTATTDLGLNTGDLSAFSTFVLVNNIRVTILAFAAGILWTIGTIYVMAYNGAILGMVAGAAVGAGNSALLVEAVAAHGILELSCIVAAGVAGLRLGSGLIAPGLRPRRIALAEEAIPAVKIVLGTAPFLVLAGFVEGFISRTGTPAAPAVIIGVILGGGYWILAATRGQTADPASEAGKRLRP